MRSRLSGIRRLAAVSATVAVSLGTTALGTASAAEDAAAVYCAKGYVCLLPLLGSGVPVLVKEGDSAKYDPALTVAEVTNNTALPYCVSGDLSHGLSPGQTHSGTNQVRLVTPSFSGMCPS
ncbi:hypothetical protein ACFYPC_21195 [Streptomyces sp. NPDC005808]|uniref:hypothetical protein n=1 Tax=Streptomyces sp. NPDC005808 TaxID=3364734 RepID=UPI003678F147